MPSYLRQQQEHLVRRHLTPLPPSTFSSPSILGHPGKGEPYWKGSLSSRGSITYLQSDTLRDYLLSFSSYWGLLNWTLPKDYKLNNFLGKRATNNLSLKKFHSPFFLLVPFRCKTHLPPRLNYSEPHWNWLNWKAGTTYLCENWLSSFPC
jgi:hypothetical protein